MAMDLPLTPQQRRVMAQAKQVFEDVAVRCTLLGDELGAVLSEREKGILQEALVISGEHAIELPEDSEEL